jgi:hypothetical protein
MDAPESGMSTNRTRAHFAATLFDRMGPPQVHEHRASGQKKGFQGATLKAFLLTLPQRKDSILTAFTMPVVHKAGFLSEYSPIFI